MIAAGSILQVSSFPARHAFTTTALGSMGLNGTGDLTVVIRRRAWLAQTLGFDGGRAALAVQVHGARVRAFCLSEEPVGGQSVLGTDALATNIPGHALLTFHADCFPLLFVDRRSGAVAAAHAGWRGLLKGVAARTVHAMVEAYATRPDDLAVLVGPGICKRCFEVGPEVAEAVAKRHGTPDRYLSTHGDRWLLDLPALARLQLTNAKVPPGQIVSSLWCTREDERWFSHRGGRRGRFLAAIVA